MGLTVLTDAQIESLLEDLSPQDYQGFGEAIERALRDNANNASRPPDERYDQPHRVTTQNHSAGATTLYMPSCSAMGMGCKVVTLSSANSTKPPIQPTGAITLISPVGKPVGFIHARTLTAFRTALPSSRLIANRRSVEVITSFGSGLQSYWHVRLALLTRGASVKRVNFVVRALSEKAKGILQKFEAVPTHIKEREGWAGTTFSLLAPEEEGDGYSHLLRRRVREADVVFCCVPSRNDLFGAEVLTGNDDDDGDDDQAQRAKGRLVVAVGSYTPEMRELPEGLLMQAVEGETSQLHFHKPGNFEKGAIVVDTIDGVMTEAGEIISAGLESEELVELGKLMDQQKEDESLTEWLRAGTVIYKSVGFGLMDLTVGTHLVQFANEKGVGTQIEGF